MKSDYILEMLKEKYGITPEEVEQELKEEPLNVAMFKEEDNGTDRRAGV